MTKLRITRRETLIGSALGIAGSLRPRPSRALADQSADAPVNPGAGDSKLRFGVITDVHQDVMHDGVERITSFVSAMKDQNVDFVLQLGDFCQPKSGNDAFMEAWRRFDGPRYHVIGNHDMDGGFSREQVVKYYGMSARYYSFDVKGLHCIVLDGNDPGGTSGGYARFVAEDQLDWLRADLEANPRPTLVFVHQPLDSSDGVDNRAEVRAILDAAGRQDGHPGVIGVFSGHSHVDYSRLLNGIYYTLINSASYVWVGGDHQHESYDPKVHEEHKWIGHTCPYQEPLWAVVTIDKVAGAMDVDGTSTKWVGPDPIACGADPKAGYWGWAPPFAAPRVSSWRSPLQGHGDLDGA